MDQRSDSSNLGIEQTIMKDLEENGLLTISEIAVRVRDRVAHIEGCVPNLSNKRLVDGITAQVEGVHDVINMLRIAPMAVIEDDSLVKIIHGAFARNPQINEAKLSIEVLNGFARIRGLVRTAAEKCIVEDEAWATCGVRAITNDVQVLSDRPIGDAEVVSDVLQGFFDCLGIDPSSVDVAFRDGVVHLRGAVSNGYLKVAAEDLAFWTPSVVAVVNDLEVIAKLEPTTRGATMPDSKLPPKPIRH